MCSNGNRGVIGSLGSGDTSLWLHNKLGTSNDSWTGGSIVSQLSSETFVKIHNCFQDLQPQVKLKLLLSLFHIPKRNLESWKCELGKILDEGKEDSEPWVCMLAEIMQTYPTTGQLNADISIPESNKRIFMDLLTDIRKALKKCCDNSDSVLPLECHYLNKNAFISVVGHQPQTVRHFTLKRKPKAAALRAELINKSQDAANKVKSISTGNFPIRKNTMPRKMDSASLKGLSSRIQTGFRNSRPTQVAVPNRTKKEGGVKLLDINEQPVGYASSKKRKRQSELEDASKQKETFSSTILTNATPVTKISSVTSSTSTTSFDNINSTPPDYAIGLASLNTRPVSCSSLITLSNSPPAYAPPVYAPPAPVSSKSVTIVNKSIINNSSSFSSGLSLEQFPPTSSIEVQQPSVFTNTTPPQRVVAVPSSNVQSRVVQLPTHPIPQGRVPHINPRGAAIPMSIISNNSPGTINNIHQQPRIISPVTVRPITQPHVIITDEIVNKTPTTQKSVLIPPSASQPPRRSLTLTKEQMHEAQEMFRTANKVTRPEKALILGFMAGSRDNPCPHLGNLVTIKLSENQDNVPQKDGTYLTMVIETHFQMNYSTGEWKRIKKYRRLDD